MKKDEKAKKSGPQDRRVGGREGREAPGAGAALRDAAQHPLEGCWAQKDWQEGGLALVTVARRLPNQTILYAVLLVDYYCLGVKNAEVGTEPSPERFRAVVLPRLYRDATAPIPILADLAHELIYGAIDYAARWGFRPHRGFSAARRLLDPQGARPATGRVTFGYQGRPLYIASPGDDVPAIMAQLEYATGQSYAHDVATLQPSPGTKDDAVWDDDDEWGDE